MAASNGFIYALQESHLPGVVVCIILFVLSAFSWTVMITKFLMINRAKKQNQTFLDSFRRSRAPLEVYCEETEFEGSPLYWIYRAGGRELTFQLLGSSQIDETLRARLRRADKITESQMDTATNSMERAVGEVALRLESQMTILATVVSGAPFLGLLGTVWGVMETFSGIASAGAGASLKSMAPGVSAALVTTVIALLVAIPAKFGYNFLVTSIRAMIVRMDNFAAELASACHRHYVDHSRRLHPLPSISTMGGSASAGGDDDGAQDNLSIPASERAEANSPDPTAATETLPGFDKPASAPPEPLAGASEEVSS